jgi:low temperature requirement protein LtrA
MGLTGVVDVFLVASAAVQVIAALLYIWEWKSKGKSPKAQMASGKKLFTVILAAAALTMAGFAVWLHDHPLRPTIIEKTVTVEKTVPCPPSNTDAATTSGAQSPANSSSGNTTIYGPPPVQPQQTSPK